MNIKQLVRTLCLGLGIVCSGNMHAVIPTKLFTLAFEGKTEELKQELKTLKENKSDEEFSKIINESNEPHKEMDYYFGEESGESDVRHEHNYLTPLDGAILGQNKEGFNILIENGAQVNASSLPLLQAVSATPDTFFIKKLLKHGAYNGYDKMLLALLKPKKDQNIEAASDLFEELLKYRIELVEKKLIKKDSPILINLFAGGTYSLSIKKTIEKKSFLPIDKLIPLLMKYGVTLNEINKDDDKNIPGRVIYISNSEYPTALHKIIRYTFDESFITTLQLLLKNGADPKIKDRFGKTLLNEIEYRSSYDVAKELWNYWGEREEINFVARQNCDEVKKLLLIYGAK